jgi:hypothetical protein
MEKSELLRMLGHHINVRPLKKYIVENINKDFKGRSQTDLMKELSSKCTSSALQEILFSFFYNIPRYIHVYHMTSGTFSGSNIKKWLQDYNVDELISGNSFASDVVADPNAMQIKLFSKANFEYYQVNSAGDPISKVKKSHFFVPTVVKFVPPRTVKIMFGKFKITKGVRNYDDIGNVRITVLDFSTDDISHSLAGTEIAAFLEKELKRTDLSKGIMKFVEDKKMSTTDFAWALADGVNNRKYWRSNSKLYKYDYVYDKISSALGLHPAKWYLTDPSKTAQSQNIDDLLNINIHPSLGFIRTGKYSEDLTIESFMDQLINESN